MIYGILARLNVDYWSRLLVGKGRPLILLYHKPDVKTFASHMEYLSRYYKFISLQELIGAVNDKSIKLPQNSVVVTFDDGHSSNYKLLDTFKQYNIRPTIYLCTALIRENRRYWWSGLDKESVEALKKIPNRERLRKLERIQPKNIQRIEKP